jgi:hypothetical protein
MRILEQSPRPKIADDIFFFENLREDPEFEVECEVMMAGS